MRDLAVYLSCVGQPCYLTWVEQQPAMALQLFLLSDPGVANVLDNCTMNTVNNDLFSSTAVQTVLIFFWSTFMDHGMSLVQEIT